MNEDSSVMSVNTDNSAVTSAISGIPISTLRVMETPIVEGAWLSDPCQDLHTKNNDLRCILLKVYEVSESKPCCTAIWTLPSVSTRLPREFDGQDCLYKH